VERIPPLTGLRVLEHLDVSHNKLVALPSLPASLQSGDARGNPLLDLTPREGWKMDRKEKKEEKKKNEKKKNEKKREREEKEEEEEEEGEEEEREEEEEKKEEEKKEDKKDEEEKEKTTKKKKKKKKVKKKKEKVTSTVKEGQIVKNQKAVQQVMQQSEIEEW